jgi:hypothetical protein
MRLVGLTIALFFGSAVARATPATTVGADESRKSDWVVQVVHDDGWTFLGMFSGDRNHLALFAKPDELTGASGDIKVMPIRYEFRVPEVSLGLSDRMIVKIDCNSQKLLLVSGTIYADNNFQGASRLANGWDTWHEAPLGTPYNDLVGVACASDTRR